MRKTTLAVVATLMGMAVASAPAQHGVDGFVVHSRESGRNARPLVTPPPYPYARVDDSRRPGFNGRLWVGETFTNQVRQPVAWGDPGPTYFGSSDRSAPLAWVRIGTQTIAVSPWVAFDSETLPVHERGRQLWLREQGYTGGVRTHVNPNVIMQAQGNHRQHASSGSALPQPRATIRLQEPRPAPVQRQRDVMVPRDGDRFSWPVAQPSTLIRFIPDSATTVASNEE